MEPNQNHIEIIQEQSSNKPEDKMDLQENPATESEQQNLGKSGSTEYIFNKNFFVDRSFHESFEGFYDEEDFFHTPEGSFFNQNREYFNRFGFDRYGGRYNDMGVYIPGEGWNSDFQCYEEDMDEEILKQQVDEIEGVFEDQIQLDANRFNVSLNSDEIVEEDEHIDESEPVDFLKVKDAMQAEAREEALRAGQNKENSALLAGANASGQPFGTASAVKNGFNNLNNNNEFFSGSAVKSSVASASKIVNNNLINASSSSHVKNNAVKADFSNSNVNNTGNNFSFNNGNSQLNNTENQTECGNLQNISTANANNDLGGEGSNLATGDENAVNVGMLQNSMPTPVKSNHAHEPTPFKVPAAELNEEKKI